MGVGKTKVLVVDDDRQLAELLKRSFESLGCEAFMVANGVEALEFLSKQSVSIIFSDVQMPQMNGFTLLQNVNSKGLEIPVVIMTGYSQYTAEEVDQNDGVVLLKKPFNRAQLKEIVDMCNLTQSVTG